MGMWDSLRGRLEIWEDDDDVPKPSPAALDAYEAATGFRLPESYRQFVLAFGPGELAEMFTIAAPGYPDNHDEDIDLGRMTRGFRKRAGFERRSDEDLATWHDDPRRAGRLVLFAKDIGPDYYGWDPEDVRDAEAHEYGIYALMHSDPRVLNLAGSFREFIEEYCLGKGWVSEVGHEWPEEDPWPRMVFSPARQLTE
jgi:hypothetical protein